MRRQKFAVAANEFAVEVDLAAAVVRALDVDHVPMDLAAVAVVGLLVGLAGRKVERARDFFVEEDVPHRMQDVRIKAEREFADVARARIGIEDLVEFLRSGCSSPSTIFPSRNRAGCCRSRCPGKWSAR